jgi:hypothetical protein
VTTLVGVFTNDNRFKLLQKVSSSLFNINSENHDNLLDMNNLEDTPPTSEASDQAQTGTSFAIMRTYEIVV